MEIASLKSKSIKKNYFYNLAYQVLTLITPLITTPYVSRVLGADGVGIYSYTSSITAYFILFGSLGISTYARREIAYVQDKPKEQSRIFWEVTSLQVIVIFISLIIYYFTILQSDANRVLYLLQAINIIAVVFDISWFFQGLEEFGKVILRNLVIKALSIIMIFSFVKTADDLAIYIFCLAIMSLLGNISMWLYLPKLLCSFDIKKDFKPFRNFNEVIQLFIPQIAIQVYTVLDKTMIGVLTGSSFENGYYEQAQKIAKLSLTIITALGTVMVPRIAFTYGNNDIKALNYYITRSYRFVWFMATPMMFGLMATANNLVPWFFGNGYEKVPILIGIFSILLLAVGLNNVTGVQYLIQIRKQNIFTITVLIGAIINFILNLVLIPKYLSIGAAVSSVIAESLIVIIQFVLVRKELNIKEICYMSIKYLFSGIVMFCILWYISKRVPSSIYGTCMLIAIGGIIYFGLLIVLKDKFFLDLLHMAKIKVGVRKL